MVAHPQVEALRLPNNILHSRMQPSTLRPNHKVFLLYMSYGFPPEDSDPASRPSCLQGPMNDAREMKFALIGLYGYREEAFFEMTDVEKNMRRTKLWPSKENILRAMVNFARNANPGDDLVFFYSGHGGKDEESGHTYILTSDEEELFDYEIRQHLIDTLPGGCRLVAILDACNSGMLLDLEYYDHYCFMPHGCSQSDAALRPWVISISAGTSNEKTWEDPEEGGGMTTELIKILRRNSSILVVDMVQQLRESLSELALKRKQKTRAKFKTIFEDQPLGTIIESRRECKSRGHFVLKSQTPQIGSLSPLRQNDRFILKQSRARDVFY